MATRRKPNEDNKRVRDKAAEPAEGVSSLGKRAKVERQGKQPCSVPESSTSQSSRQRAASKNETAPQGQTQLRDGQSGSAGIRESARQTLSQPEHICTFVPEEAIRDLSRAFYTRVFADNADSEFRELFTSRSSLEKAVLKQSQWLIEYFGGSKGYSALHGALLDHGPNGRFINKHMEIHPMKESWGVRWAYHMLLAQEHDVDWSGRHEVSATVAESVKTVLTQFWIESLCNMFGDGDDDELARRMVAEAQQQVNGPTALERRRRGVKH